MTPKPHQQALIDANPPKHLIAFGTGLGKTFTVLELCRKNGVKRPLIICPKGLTYDKWRDEELPRYALPRYATTPGRCGIDATLVTKEQFKKNVKAYIMDTHDALIVDEAHYFCKTTSQLSKALAYYISLRNPRYIWLLTATPYLSEPFDVRTLANYLGYNWSYTRFRDFYYFRRCVGWASKGGKRFKRYAWLPKKNMEVEVAISVGRIGTTATFADAGIIEPPQHNVIVWCGLTHEQKVHLANSFATHPFSQFATDHQIENGIRSGDEWSDAERISDTKIDKILGFMETHKRVVIFAKYSEQLHSYSDALSKAGIPNVVIEGATKDRVTVLESVRHLPTCAIIIQAQISEGYELSDFDTVIFASLSWAHKDHLQARGRVQRLKNVKTNNYYYLIAGEADKRVYYTVIRQQNVTSAIFNQSKKEFLQN